MRRLVPALSALLLCAACAVPVFDPSMSAAVKTFRASHAIGTSHPTIGPDFDTDGKPDWDLKSEHLTFMPQRWDAAVDWENGFVIRREEWSSWNQVWYQWFDGSTVQWISSPAGWDEEEGLRWRWPVSVKGGSYLGAIIFEWSDPSTFVERLWADTVVPSCNWSPAYGSYDPGMDIDADLPAISGEPVIVGAALRPLSASPDDRLQMLVRNGTLFSEVWADINGSTGNPTFNVTVLGLPYALDVPSTARHGTYARDDAESRSFAQLPQDDGWHTWAWRGNLVTTPAEFDQPVAVDHRIDAVLPVDPGWGWPAGSYLLSTEKQIGRIYRYNGPGTAALVAEFGLGTLHFVTQAYLGGEWQLVFSRTLVNSTANPTNVRFEVRGLYTKDLLAAFGL